MTDPFSYRTAKGVQDAIGADAVILVVVQNGQLTIMGAGQGQLGLSRALSYLHKDREFYDLLVEPAERHGT
jgi:hypothetical protein